MAWTWIIPGVLLRLLGLLDVFLRVLHFGGIGFLRRMPVLDPLQII